MNDVMRLDRGRGCGGSSLGMGFTQTPQAASLKLLTKFSGKHTAKTSTRANYGNNA